jgi:hypothetical protein
MTEDPEHSELFFDSPCFDCKHYDFWGEYGVFTMKCKAFPEGIPLEIWTNKNTHRKSYPGDTGIQYEKLNKETDDEYNRKKEEHEKSAKEGLLWLKQRKNK